MSISPEAFTALPPEVQAMLAQHGGPPPAPAPAPAPTPAPAPVPAAAFTKPPGPAPAPAAAFTPPAAPAPAPAAPPLPSMGGQAFLTQGQRTEAFPIQCAFAGVFVLNSLVHTRGPKGTHFFATCTVEQCNDPSLLPGSRRKLIVTYDGDKLAAAQAAIAAGQQMPADNLTYKSVLGIRELAALCAAVSGVQPDTPGFDAETVRNRLIDLSAQTPDLGLRFVFTQTTYTKRDGGVGTRRAFAPVPVPEAS